MHNLKEVHLQGAYRVLYYVKGLLGKGFMFKKNDKLLLQTYKNENYAELVVNRRFTTD